MVQVTNQLVSSLFYHVCVLVAFSTIFWCIWEFAKNEDTTLISFEAFDSKEQQNQYPILTLCFLDEDSMLHSMLGKNNDEGVNVTTYADFLKGKHWDDKMMQIEYDSVTMDIRDYIIGTCVTTMESSECIGVINIEPFTFLSTAGTYKCFSFLYQVETSLDESMIALNNSMFPSGKRPRFGRFLILWHYPYQIIRAISLPMFHRWQYRGNAMDSYYVMDFYLSNVEIFKRRANGAKTCSVSERYDFETTEKIIKSVGCQPPYWKSNQSYSKCSSSKQLLDMKHHYDGKLFKSNIHQGYILPCVEINKMEVEYTETGGKERKTKFNINIYENFEKDAGTNLGWFIINTHFWKSTIFKEIRQIRVYSFQNLIGNAGGYLGLFVGITISQIPTFLFNVYGKLKSRRISGGLVSGYDASA